MLGSLTLYRRLLLENVFSNPRIRPFLPFSSTDLHTLPSFGHGIAGILAGTTVSFIAAPVEHIKARLQVQYAADKSKRMYSGPIDCILKIVSDPPPGIQMRRGHSMQRAQFMSTDQQKKPPKVPRTRNSRYLPWPLGHNNLSFILFLLVELLRSV